MEMAGLFVGWFNIAQSAATSRVKPSEVTSATS